MRILLTNHKKNKNTIDRTKKFARLEKKKLLFRKINNIPATCAPGGARVHVKNQMYLKKHSDEPDLNSIHAPALISVLCVFTPKSFFLW